MNPAPDNPTLQMRFRRTWRPYQERVLRVIEEHLSDRRIHVVAAPGAGKTTLGLEVFRRLGQPALVLAPSRTIRDQWISRLHDFLPDETAPHPWAGTTFEEETFFTAVTYQALHTKFRRTEEEADDDETPSVDDKAPTESELAQVIARCRRLGVGTVILDEAHHLRQEWWRALSQFNQAIGDPVLICLTATPPYDVVSLEWRRYEELCGPIDEEISVPELVRAGTLCPHQDYIWACPPSPKDVVTARQHDQTVAAFMEELAADATLLQAIQGHPWVTAAQPDPEVVLDDPELAVAIMVLLKRHGVAPPAALLELLDCRWEELPAIDRRWWSVLLRQYLFGEEWAPAFEEHREALARRMRKLGLLHRRELRLLQHTGLQSALRESSAKIDSCVAIHRLERQVRGADLRQVILTDFIREDEVDRLGAWAVFNRIVRMAPEGEAAGVALLTGRLAMVHTQLLPELPSAQPEIGATPDPELRDFVRIAEGGRVAEGLTKLLGGGRLHTLVGTRALLGEGWDCPAVNSLVLASYVGAFMTTNQMRGRAIRIDAASPHKAASIWHLVAIEPTTPTGRCDLVQMEEKFASFAGLHATQPVIETGLKRLMMGELAQPEHLPAWNTESTRRVAQLGELGARWKAAVELGVEHRVLSAVEAPPQPELRSFVYANTMRYLLYSGFSGFMTGAGPILENLRAVSRIQHGRWVLPTLAIAGVAGLAFSLPKFLKWAWIAVRHLPADGSLRQIAWALLDGLLDNGAIKSPRRQLDVRCQETEPGRFSLALTGGTFFESSLFADSLEELLGPIENPRYLVSRTDTRWRHFQQHDYHAVPLVLSARKESAEMFHRHWRRRIGSGDLIYTRSPEGRRLLLQARVRALSTTFAAPVRRKDQWC